MFDLNTFFIKKQKIDIINGIEVVSDSIDFYSLFTILGVLFFGLLIYFLPVFIAFIRKNTNKLEIFIINFCLGWSVFGWFVALILAFKR